MEEPDSGFHAVGVLTRSPAWEYGWKFNYLTENTSGAEKSEVKEKIPPKPLTALEHLERCGYKIVQQVVPKKLPPIAVQRMAWKTGEALCDPVVVDFLQFIRTHMQSDGSQRVLPRIRLPHFRKSLRRGIKWDFLHPL